MHLNLETNRKRSTRKETSSNTSWSAILQGSISFLQVFLPQDRQNLIEEGEGMRMDVSL